MTNTTPTTGGRTAVEVRQTIPNGMVAELRSMLAAVVALPTINPDDPETAFLVGRDLTRFTDEQALKVIEIIDATGTVEWLVERIYPGGKRMGRPTRVSIRALMVAILLSVLDYKGTLLTAFRDVLFHRLSRAIQDELGITPLIRSAVNRTNERRDRAAYAATRRTFVRLMTALDPTIHAKGRKRTWEELDASKRDLTVEEQQELQAALDAFVTRLLTATMALLPSSSREMYDGSACVDGTHIELWARGRAKTDTRASSDPDGGFYSREGDHGEADTAKKESVYSLDLHTMVASDVSHPDRLYMPSLAIAVAAARPGVDPSGHTRRLLAATAEAGHEPGYLTGDGLYTDQLPENYQDEARQLGWNLLLAFPDKHLGVKTAYGHVIGVEGDLYCPSMPQPLIDATIDYRADRINKAEYDRRIAAREAFLMRPHERRGDATRYACPASGACPQVMCQLKPKSMEPHPTTLIEGGQKIDSRPVVIPVNAISKSSPPAVCRQNTITIPDSVNARYDQGVRFGTDEYDRLYATLRGAQEGYHGFAKDEAKEALAEPGKRRVPGLTAQTVFAGFAYMAANMRKISVFLRDAQPDEHGSLYVPRPKVTEARASYPEPEPAAPPLAA